MQLVNELEVLAQAVKYTNLSAASSHVGLSQPQLSRIVQKIEGSLGIVLLDRSARRKSGWTPMAYRLSETFQKNLLNLNTDIGRLIEGLEPSSLKVGTLEGLSALASVFVDRLFELENVKQIELDIFDIGDLEEMFLKGNLDFIFTFREPGKKKYTHVRSLGYQTLEMMGDRKDIGVMSPFELHGLDKKAMEKGYQKILISNSLDLRRRWIEEHGGRGKIPSEVRAGRKPNVGDPDVLLLGGEHLGAKLWKIIEQFELS